jgi:flagellar capping protein FliD
LDQQTDDNKERIDSMNTRLEMRYNALYAQFAQAQALIQQMTYQAQQNNALYNYSG